MRDIKIEKQEASHGGIASTLQALGRENSGPEHPTASRQPPERANDRHVLFDFIAKNNLQLVNDDPDLLAAMGEITLPQPVRSPRGYTVDKIPINLGEAIEGDRHVFVFSFLIGTSADGFQLTYRMSCLAKLRSLAFQTIGDALVTLRRIASESDVKSALDLRVFVQQRFKLPARLPVRRAKPGLPQKIKCDVTTQVLAQGPSSTNSPGVHQTNNGQLAGKTLAVIPKPSAQTPLLSLSAPSGVQKDLPDKIEDWIIEIKTRVQNQCSEFIQTTIGIGLQFLSAQKKYDRTLKELAAKTDLAYNTVTQYVKVAQMFESRSDNWAPAQLPASMDSLVRLSRLKPEQLQEALKDGRIKPDMGRKEVLALVKTYFPTRIKNNPRTAVELTVSSEPNQAQEIETNDDPAATLPFDLDLRRQELKTAILRQADGWLPEHADELIEVLQTIEKDILKGYPSEPGPGHRCLSLDIAALNQSDKEEQE